MKAPCQCRQMYACIFMHTFACNIRGFSDSPNTHMDLKNHDLEIREQGRFYLLESSSGNLELEPCGPDGSA